jgi:hypothetical protein
MPMLLPPSQYDHPPQIPVIEKVVPWNELQQLCRARERAIYNGTGYGVWGCAIVAEATLFAHGFWREMLAGLVLAGLATVTTAFVGAGGPAMKVDRYRITPAGRKAIKG